MIGFGAWGLEWSEARWRLRYWLAVHLLARAGNELWFGVPYMQQLISPDLGEEHLDSEETETGLVCIYE